MTVIHLHRLRNALRILVAPATDPTRITDPTWLRQADTALNAIAEHHHTLPARHRAPLAVLVDADADPSRRRQALLTATRRLRIEPLPRPADDGGPDASVVCHPAHHAQGQLFDPA